MSSPVVDTTPVATPVPKKEKKSKKTKDGKKSKKSKGEKKSKKVKSESTPSVVVEPTPPVVEPAPVAEPTPPVVSEVKETPLKGGECSGEGECSLQTRLEAHVKTLQDELDAKKKQLTLAKAFVKDFIKMRKELTKKSKKKSKKVADPNAKPSGFNKPTDVSDEMCDFIGVAHGTLVARTKVSKEVANYYKSKGLQVESDKRLIKPDDVLKKLLRLTSDEPIHMFKLQSFLKVHYPKKAKA